MTFVCMYIYMYLVIGKQASITLFCVHFSVDMHVMYIHVCI